MRKSSSAAEIPSPTHLALQLSENMLVWLRLQQMSHHQDFSIFFPRENGSCDANSLFLLIVHHIAVVISFKIVEMVGL